MASEEEVFNLSACREVLRSFSLSNTERSVEGNLHQAHAHHDSLMHPWVAALEMAQLLGAKWESVEQIIEEEQDHRAQVAALSQMQLQAMERVDAQEKELWRLGAQLVEHQVILRFSPERPHQESPQPSPPWNLAQLGHEVMDHLPSTINNVRGAATKTGQVPNVGRPPIIKKDTFEDILADEEVPMTPQRWAQFDNMITSTPIPRPVAHLEVKTPHLGASQVPSIDQGLFDNPELWKDFSEEGFSWSLLVVATEFQKLREPKVAKLKGGHSSNASLVSQLWLKDIQIYVLEHHLSQQEVIQLVKDYSSNHAWLEVE